VKTLEERVREIADREEIKELTAKYAHWVALGEGARVAQLFTDDGHRGHCEQSRMARS
jgi:SnoaL-like protein